MQGPSGSPSSPLTACERSRWADPDRTIGPRSCATFRGALRATSMAKPETCLDARCRASLRLSRCALEHVDGVDARAVADHGDGARRVSDLTGKFLIWGRDVHLRDEVVVQSGALENPVHELGGLVLMTELQMSASEREVDE